MLSSIQARIIPKVAFERYFLDKSREKKLKKSNVACNNVSQYCVT